MTFVSCLKQKILGGQSNRTLRKAFALQKDDWVWSPGSHMISKGCQDWFLSAQWKVTLEKHQVCPHQNKNQQQLLEYVWRKHLWIPEKLRSYFQSQIECLQMQKPMRFMKKWLVTSTQELLVISNNTMKTFNKCLVFLIIIHKKPNINKGQIYQLYSMVWILSAYQGTDEGFYKVKIHILKQNFLWKDLSIYILIHFISDFYITKNWV